MINKQLTNLITNDYFTGVASYKDEEDNNALHLLFKEGSGPEDPSFDYSRPGSYPTS